MDPKCIEVPFIMYGSNVNNSNGNTMQGYVRNLDVAATVASALGIIKLPKCWISKSVGLSLSDSTTNSKSSANMGVNPIASIIIVVGMYSEISS